MNFCDGFEKMFCDQNNRRDRKLAKLSSALKKIAVKGAVGSVFFLGIFAGASAVGYGAEYNGEKIDGGIYYHPTESIVNSYVEMAGNGSVLNAQEVGLYDDGETIGYRSGQYLANFDDLSVSGSLYGTEIVGVGRGTDAQVAGDLNLTAGRIYYNPTEYGYTNYIDGNGNIRKVGSLEVGGNAQFNELYGTGAGSVYAFAGNESAKAIYNAETVSVDGAAVNAEISGTGIGSSFKAKRLGRAGAFDKESGYITYSANTGDLSNFQNAEVTESLYNYGSLTGVGHESSFTVTEGGLVNDGTDGDGVISGFSTLKTSKAIENYYGKISGTGDESKMEIDNGNLINGVKESGRGNNVIDKFATVNVGGSFKNHGTIVGTGVDSALKIGTNTNLISLDLNNYELIQNFESISVGGALSNIGVMAGVSGTLDDAEAGEGEVFGVGDGSTIKVGTELGNSGTIEGYAAIKVGDKVENFGHGNIIGTGRGASFKTDASFTNTGSNSALAGFELLSVATDLTNKGGLVEGTGLYSTADIRGNLNNSGSFTQYSGVEIGADMKNSGTVYGVGDGTVYNISGDLFNHTAIEDDELAGGLIADVARIGVEGDLCNGGMIFVANGDNGALNVGGLLLNGYMEDDNVYYHGMIAGYQTMNVRGSASNAEGSLIIGAGKGSVYSFNAADDELGTALTNGGQIRNVESMVVDGTLQNWGAIAATESVDSSANEGLYSTMVVKGDVYNGILGQNPLTSWSAQKIGTGDGETDYRELHRPEYPTRQTYSFKDKQISYIVNYSNMDVDGAFSNFNNGYIQGTGSGSTYNFGSVKNFGVFTNIERFNVDGRPLVVSATSAQVGAYEPALQGDLINGLDGLIEGAGAASYLSVSGNLYNDYGATIRDFSTVQVGRDMMNEGVLEFFDNVDVQGDFVNSYRHDTGNSAVGGVIVTGTRDGRIGKITVQGDAEINGGELWIRGDGEQLQVGKDYTIMTVNDGHLTVNEALQIRANNEYGYDSLLADNYEAGSSNRTRSAIPRLFHAEGFYTDSDYWVSLRRDFVYGKPGLTFNQKNVGTYLDQVAYTLNSASDTYAEGDLFNVLSSIDNENIKEGNIPSADYGYTDGSDAGYTYASPAAAQTGITVGALNALDQMSGEIFADMSIMSMQNTWLVQRYLSNFLAPNPCQCDCECYASTSCCGDDGWGFGWFKNAWAMGYGSIGDVESDGNAYGFDYDTAGILVGGDFFRNGMGRMGFYFNFGSSNLDKDTLYQQKADINNYQVGLYGMRDFCWGHLLGVASVGLDNYKTSRQLSFGNIDRNSNYVNRLHRGETESTQFAVRIEQNWNWCCGFSVINPFIAAAYGHANVDGIQEWTEWGDRQDGQYVTELHNSDYELDSMRAEIGARLSRCLVRCSRSLHANARASWVHEFADTNATVTNSFTNRNYDVETTGYGNAYNTLANNAYNSNQFNACSYQVSGVDLGRDYVWGGVGLTWSDVTSPVSIFCNYDVFANDRTMLHNGTAGLEFNW